MLIKTENSNATISKIRGVRLWQLFFPVKKVLDVYEGAQVNNVYYVFNKPADASAHSKDLAYWAATMAHNSVVEFRDYSAEFGLPNPPSGLNIIVTNWGVLRGSGSAPMFNKCHNNSIQNVLTAFFVASGNLIAGGITALSNACKNRLDITISYLTESGEYQCALTSPRFKEIVYHELGHAQHYSQAGCHFWTNYRGAIINELTKLNQPELHPYGSGNDPATAPIIATGEMWGNHCEYIYTNRRYGNGGAASGVFSAPMQGIEYLNSSIPGLTPYLAAIESHNPNSPNDVWPWIPQGLPYDLFDNRNDNLFPIATDEAFGYSYFQSFNALQSDVRSIPVFRNRLLIQNGNNQQAQVIQLFQQYGY